MKVLVESYNTVKQNISGGVQVRINKFLHYSDKQDLNITLFDKWKSKLDEYDILHIFKMTTEDYAIMMMAKSKDIPVVISAVVPSENAIKIIMHKIICKILPIHTGYWYLDKMLNQADAVIAQTNKERNFIIKYYGVNPNNIHVIPNGVNIEFKEEFKNEFAERTGIREKYILQVGRFDKNKNQLNVIKAMKGSKIPVVFIGGEDPLEKEYYEECRKSADSNIHFLGWIKHDDPLLSSAYQNAHVVVLPSYKEIFGNSLIEGGGAGANLIATRELPIDDWGIKDICKCINPNSVEDIRSSIIEAYEGPLDPKTSRLINEKFSWDSVIKQHIEVYNQVCRDKRSV